MSKDNVSLTSVASDNEKLKVKEAHSCSDGHSFFPKFKAIFGILIFSCICLFLIGIFLIIGGNWANSGYFAFFAITDRPWPNKTVKDRDAVLSTLKFLQASLWFSGALFLAFTVVVIYEIFALNSLMFAEYPWEYQKWNSVRRGGDEILFDAKVRSKTETQQMAFMSQEQQKDMTKYKRQIVEPQPETV